MTHFLPTLKGWVSFLLALFASMFLPSLLPARNGHTGNFFAPVSAGVLVIAILTLVICLWATIHAFKGSRPDKVAASLAMALILLLIVNSPR